MTLTENIRSQVFPGLFIQPRCPRSALPGQRRGDSYRPDRAPWDILGSTSWGTGPASTRIYLGELVESRQLKTVWIKSREMVHYAFPLMPEKHPWLEEEPQLMSNHFPGSRPAKSEWQRLGAI
jgi:hypothetical protein